MSGVNPIIDTVVFDTSLFASPAAKTQAMLPTDTVSNENWNTGPHRNEPELRAIYSAAETRVMRAKKRALSESKRRMKDEPAPTTDEPVTFTASASSDSKKKPKIADAARDEEASTMLLDLGLPKHQPAPLGETADAPDYGRVAQDVIAGYTQDNISAAIEGNDRQGVAFWSGHLAGDVADDEPDFVSVLQKTPSR